MDVVEAKVTKTVTNPIHARLAVMSNLSASMNSAAEDLSLTPNTKQGLLAALASDKMHVAKEIIDMNKNRSEQK